MANEKGKIEENKKLDVENKRLRGEIYDKGIENQKLFNEKLGLIKDIGDLNKKKFDSSDQLKVIQGQILTANGKLKDTQKKTEEELAKVNKAKDENEGILAKIEEGQKALIDKRKQDLEADARRKEKEQKIVSDRAKLDQDEAAFKEKQKEHTKVMKEVGDIKKKEQIAFEEIEKKSGEIEETLTKAKETKVRAEDKETKANQKLEQANIKFSEAEASLNSANDKKVELTKQEFNIKERQTKQDEKENSLNANYANLEAKKQEFEIIKLRLEKFARDKSLKDELTKLKKDLGIK